MTGDLVLNPGLALRISLSARRRGRPLAPADLSAAADPAALASCLVALRSASDPASLLRRLAPSMRRELIRIGALVPRRDVPAPVSFSCPLSARLLGLVPREALSRRERPGPLRLRRAFRIQTGLERPADWQPFLPPPNELPSRDGAADFGPGESILWVRDPATGMRWPYWLDAASRAEISSIAAGRLRPRDLPDERRLLLRLAGLLPPSGERIIPPAPLRRRFGAVRGMVPPLQVAALRRYCRALASEGYLSLGRQEGRPQRLVSHDDRAAAFVHRQSGSLVSRLAGEPLIPSYSLISAYLPGASLKRHVDRPQCRWNVSLLVDMDPETPRSRSWPFFLQGPRGAEAVRLSMGDGVLYPGTEIPHWRDALPRGARQTLLFFHYVPLGFPGSLG